jgi:hypothetical protein
MTDEEFGRRCQALFAGEMASLRRDLELVIAENDRLKSDLAATQRALLWFVDKAPGMQKMPTSEYEQRMAENEKMIAMAREATHPSE